MVLKTEDKKQQVLKIKDLFNNSYSVVAWNYAGLKANEISELRNLLTKENSQNIVFKNRIFRIALKELNKNELSDSLIGSNSFLFIEKEESDSLKILFKFLKDKQLLDFKGGYIENLFYDKISMEEIASLPSKNELISMLLSTLQGSMRNLAYALSQVSEKK